MSENNYITKESPEKISVEYDKLFDFSKYEIIELKLNQLTTLQNKEYDPDKYKPEETLTLKNQKGNIEEKYIPLNDFMRWRYIQSESDRSENRDTDIIENDQVLDKFLNINVEKKEKESNTRLVEWSDGSFQLVIGNKFFDMVSSQVDNYRLAVETNFKNKIEEKRDDDDKEYKEDRSDQENFSDDDSLSNDKNDLKNKSKNKANDFLFVINNPIKKRMTIQSCAESELIGHKKENIDESKVKVAYSFYDKKEFNKDMFEKSGKFIGKLDDEKQYYIHRNENRENDDVELRRKRYRISGL